MSQGAATDEARWYTVASTTPHTIFVTKIYSLSMKMKSKYKQINSVLISNLIFEILDVHTVRLARCCTTTVIQKLSRLEHPWLYTASTMFHMCSPPSTSAKSTCKLAIEERNMRGKRSSAIGSSLRTKLGLKPLRLPKSKKRLRWVAT